MDLPEPERLPDLPMGMKGAREVYKAGGKEAHRVVWMEPPPEINVNGAYLKGFRHQIELIRNVSDAYATYELIRGYYDKLGAGTSERNSTQWALLLITGQATQQSSNPGNPQQGNESSLWPFPSFPITKEVPMVILQAHAAYEVAVKNKQWSKANGLWAHYEKYFQQYGLKKVEISSGSGGTPDVKRLGWGKQAFAEKPYGKGIVSLVKLLNPEGGEDVWLVDYNDESVGKGLLSTTDFNEARNYFDSLGGKLQGNPEDVKRLWEQLGNTPVDNEGHILQPFLHFPTGTDREIIWKWFEQTYKVSVHDLMFSKGNPNDLQAILKKEGEYVKQHGGLTEADFSINDIQREKITAYQKQHPNMHVGLINRHDRTRNFLQKYAGEKVYNFGWDFIIPQHDTELLKLLLAREQAAYTGTKEDVERLKPIWAKIEQLGGLYLLWV